MDTFEKFEHGLRDTLAHLYDPAYQPAELMWAVTGCDPQQGVESIQTALIRAVESLKPTSSVPRTARAWRIYELLFCRYVQSLTQEKAAERLGITPRHLRREQQEAVCVLARHLWEPSRVKGSVSSDRATEEERPLPGTAESAEWYSQVRQELASLQKCAPGAVADVGETIQSAVKLGTPLTSRHGVSLLAVKRVHPDLIVAIHPSALRQILITAIEKLVRHMSSGQITLDAERGEECVSITVTGHPIAVERPPSSDLIREILTAQGGSSEVHVHDNRISFVVELPVAEKITVLVVDDNADLVHFYRRYTAGTRYEIVHVAEGQRVFETIENSTPDVIVLDVMLPDIDGWELLVNLHEHPATKSTPVIVCSVVRREELAVALGATLYVPKPVRRQSFIQALDQALSWAATGAPKAPASNAATC
jgi:CheY-like chemotaxis protein